MTASFASIAIGGTKCSVALAIEGRHGIEWIGRRRFATMDDPIEVISVAGTHLEALCSETWTELSSIGLVCGGPLDEGAGLVLSPPNLPQWHRVDVVTPFRNRFSVPVRLVNDANAGVLAEWMWGAARGANDAVFITMGTGLGAGMLLGGRLQGGASGLAGEIGHWRLSDNGPSGYGKDGSFEGFCSGSGIAKWARGIAAQNVRIGAYGEFEFTSQDPADITAESLALAADAGDEAAINLWSDIGAKLGTGLALVIDILNPDVIVIGGIFNRQRHRLEMSMKEVLSREALAESLATCHVVESELGEEIAEYSGLVAALIGNEQTEAGAILTEAARDRSRDAANINRVGEEATTGFAASQRSLRYSPDNRKEMQ